MDALRIRLYQETACYKKPFAFKVGETYPLPPYSTVKGFLHALLGADSLIPMNISVQGSHETKILDYQSHYFFKKHNSAEVPIILDGLPRVDYTFKDFTQMPIYVHLLFNVNILIHVAADVEILRRIENGLETMDSHPSLGRWEDLIRVDECKFVKLEKLSPSKPIGYDAYVPRKQLEDFYESCRAIPYRLNWTYEIKNGVREWDTVDVGYIRKGEDFGQEEVLVDDEGEIAFFL